MDHTNSLKKSEKEIKQKPTDFGILDKVPKLDGFPLITRPIIIFPIFLFLQWVCVVHVVILNTINPRNIGIQFLTPRGGRENFEKVRTGGSLTFFLKIQTDLCL